MKQKQKRKWTAQDLKSIASFHRIIKNYLEMLKIKASVMPLQSNVENQKCQKFASLMENTNFVLLKQTK